MPLTWQWPPPSTTFGPGSYFSLTQTDIGPIPIDDVIDIQVRDDLEQVRYIWGRRAAEASNVWLGLWATGKYGLANFNWQWMIEARIPAKEGEQLRLYAEQRHANGTIVGTISIPITYSPTVTAFIPNVFGQQTTTLPPDVVPQLDRIESAVYQVFPHA